MAEMEQSRSNLVWKYVISYIRNAVLYGSTGKYTYKEYSEGMWILFQFEETIKLYASS